MSFISYDYAVNAFTNTFEQYTISTNKLELIDLTHDEMLEEARKTFFDFDYPFYVDDVNAKEDWEKLFLQRFWMEPWNAETSGLMKFWVQGRLRMVMPTYKQLYETTLYEYNPLENHNLTREIKRSGNENEVGSDTTNIDASGTDHTSISNSNTNNTQNIHSDAPQVNFSGNDYASTMDRGQEREVFNGSTTNTNSVNQTANGSSLNQSDFENNEEFKEHGYLGNVQDSIEKVRDLILNINQQLTNEFRDLFFPIVM